MKAYIIAAAALFAAAPAVADQSVVAPDEGTTVIQHEDRDGDDDVIMQRQPDATVRPDEGDNDDAESPNEGSGSGEDGADVETHDSEPPPSDDR